MTDILLLGSFHFLNTDRDIYAPETQAELETLAQALLRFAPDAVAVEAASHQQEAVSAAYRKFDLSDLRDVQKMRTETLGEIKMFGEICPITYNNETIQIGFRVAKQMHLPDVYAIDDDSGMDGTVFENPSPALREAIERMGEFERREKTDTLIERLRCLNGAEWSRYNHAMYMRANEIERNGDCLGARTVAQWYARNLTIFSHLQRLAMRHERIFAVYGAGHLQILRDLIRADDRLHLIDAEPYFSDLKLRRGK